MRLYYSVSLALGASAREVLLVAPLLDEDKSTQKMDAFVSLLTSAGNTVSRKIAVGGKSLPFADVDNCSIAVSGTSLSSPVVTLRRCGVRDQMTSAPGCELAKRYSTCSVPVDSACSVPVDHTHSAPVAAFIADYSTARFATRVAQTPLVSSVNHPDTDLAMALALGLESVCSIGGVAIS